MPAHLVAETPSAALVTALLPPHQCTSRLRDRGNKSVGLVASHKCISQRCHEKIHTSPGPTCFLCMRIPSGVVAQHADLIQLSLRRQLADRILPSTSVLALKLCTDAAMGRRLPLPGRN